MLWRRSWSISVTGLSATFGEFFAYNTHAFLHSGISAVGDDVQQRLDYLGFGGANCQRRVRMDTQRGLHGLAPDCGEG